MIPFLPALALISRGRIKYVQYTCYRQTKSSDIVLSRQIRHFDNKKWLYKNSTRLQSNYKMHFFKNGQGKRTNPFNAYNYG